MAGRSVVDPPAQWPRPTRYEFPYLDSTVWIDYLGGVEGAGGDERRAAVAVEIFERAERGEMKISASTMAAAEIVSDPTIDDEGVHDLKRFFRRSCFVWIQLSLPIAEHARELARAHKLKPPDAVHLASAIAARADVLLTSDDPFVKRATGGPFLVAKPYFPFERPLPIDRAQTEEQSEL